MSIERCCETKSLETANPHSTMGNCCRIDKRPMTHPVVRIRRPLVQQKNIYYTFGVILTQDTTL